MRKKVLSAFLVLLLILTCVACQNKNESNDSSTDTNDSNLLQIFKSEYKLTQEQLMSQIKAEYLKNNGGYLDSDEVIMIIEIDDHSLTADYLNNPTTTATTVAEYSLTSAGKRLIKSINQQQEELIEKLTSQNLINSVEYQYSTVINGIAVKAKYGNLKKISQLSNVSNTYLADTFNLPKSTTGTDTSAIENVVDVYETGIFNSSSVEYTGEGTAVAVLDSGFDCSHSVFSNIPNNQMISPDDIESVLDKTNAYKLSADKNFKLALKDVYYSGKIPYVYDYADKDADVFPFDSEHGTHVAGIIGGKDDYITGVAINTQLVLLKVFPDLDEGASTEDILAALEDAVLLGVDAINMSLGSSCGFAREEDGNVINDVYDRLNESGISVLTAASNSYSSGFGGEQGNTNLVTNPDSGTVGSPSTYGVSLSVASISGTKSKYLFANNQDVIFFKESNSVTGDENDFFKELGVTKGESKTYEYVTIPGVGLKVNYSTVGDLTGKIALVRRGSNTFEEKAQNAKNAGAVACIIYNNVEGEISMSMGKSEHIPTISISKENGTKLAEKDSGTITISYDYQAGPFMSDFSSWGPTPSLGLKPEITAHGGNITSSVPGGGYDQISGTSMATPNLCGIVVLIRQYLKEKYPTYSSKEISVLTNELLMSTANIVLNEQGNPYSPRKQGAGLASLYNSVNTKAYLTVDGSDRSKLELYDDPKRTGVYEMNFNVVNLSDTMLTYDFSIIAMTESVSTSDEKYVAEKSQILDDHYTIDVISGGTIDGQKVKIEPSETAKIKVVYTLSNEDKQMIDSLFPYGMYVEGFVKLEAENEEEISLNMPFLAFYGDWTEAPMFDKTYFEVESEAHDGSINEEDKLKADYFATTPYGSYFYNYIIPLGTYVYNVDETKYDVIPASEDKIAISDYLGTIDGISSIYAGLLRCAKTMKFSIVDKLTGEVVYEMIDYNANKAYSYGGSPVPYYNFLKIKSAEYGLINNRQYEFKMEGLLDYGDGGATTNARNSFSFDFYLDNEAPVIKEVSYEKEYDKTLKKDRYYLTMVVYDNHYVQSITPLIFTSSSSYAVLSNSPIPVYGEKGKDATVRFEITDYLEDICADALLPSALAFSIDDYALNSNIYCCQLPGTKGDFKFTKDGKIDGVDQIILSINEGEVVDITKYLATSDKTVDEEKDYLKYLIWESSNEKIATVEEGLVLGKSVGRTIITVKENLNGKLAKLIINVRAGSKDDTNNENIVADDATIKSIRFSYFDTLFAYSRAAQTSEIGETGDRRFISSMSSLSFYPGEKIQLFHDLDPWYAEDNYELSYESTNPNVAVVDENGVVTGLKEGSTNIVLNVKGSTLKARIRITIKNEFVIENRTLIAYKGLGGEVVIPDDEGILYIGAYAFCLYDTDSTIELTDEDYDANKIPSMNTTITKIVIPDGVEEIQKYAFYNCIGLKEVEIPDSVRFIKEFAFAKDEALTTINLSKVEVIGREAFKDCKKLTNISLDKTYTIGIKAFEGCSSLTTVDLTTLRNTGREAFKDCSSLTSVVLSENTKLSYAMFANAGLVSVDIYEKVEIPTFCFAKCKDLTTVTLHNDLIEIGLGAFSQCESLQNFTISGHVGKIGEQAFYQCQSLTTFVLPNNNVVLGGYAFLECNNLTSIEFLENTLITDIQGSIFEKTNLLTFIVDLNNQYYTVDNYLLLDKTGTTIILGAVGYEYNDFILDNKYLKINDGAFSGVNITSLTITNQNIEIGQFAFANCEKLISVTLPSEGCKLINQHAFNYATSLETVSNLDKVTDVRDYAFANTALKEVVLGKNATFGEGAFFQSKLQKVTIGANSTFGLGAFQSCKSLVEVVMPENGNVTFGEACFAFDIQLEIIDLTKTNIIKMQTFNGCVSLKKADLSNVETIGDYAFADCTSLNYLNIPKVTSIGEGAFSRYSESGGSPIFANVELPNTLVTIGDGAFMGCNGLTKITIPASLTSLSDYLFTYCVNLAEVTLPETIKHIGCYAFYKCENLTKINLENVETIDEYAFMSCLSLAKVSLESIEVVSEAAFASTNLSGSIVANNLKAIGDYAFFETSIEEFEANSLEKIGEKAFENNQKLTKFTFTSNIKEVKSRAFNGCINLESYYYRDGEKEITSSIINDYARLIDGVLYTTLATSNLELTSIPGGMKKETLEIVENTYRIDEYAGSANTNIKKLIFPDTLKSIGTHAFYGYNSLEEVEFKSYTAPALENAYDDDASLSEKDPGYDLLHGYFDMFNFELCYYNFIDLVGKKNPIKMILPANSTDGYESIIYQGYFGKVEDATHSDYVAMEKNMIEFIDYAKEIAKINEITLNDEKLINNAITAYNSIKQNATDYGYTEEEWNQLVEIAQSAKKVIAALKLSKASKEVQLLQAEIEELDTSFDISKLAMLQDLQSRINSLTIENRGLLDLTKYNELLSSYNNYVSTVNAEGDVIVTSISQSFIRIMTIVIASSIIGFIAIRKVFINKGGR